MNRIQTLEEIIEQDPNNVFARYGLAMEYANSGQADRALKEFVKDNKRSEIQIDPDGKPLAHPE